MALGPRHKPSYWRILLTVLPGLTWRLAHTGENIPHKNGCKSWLGYTRPEVVGDTSNRDRMMGDD